MFLLYIVPVASIVLLEMQQVLNSFGYFDIRIRLQGCAPKAPCFRDLPIPTAAQSKINLQQWLDNVIIRLTSQDTLVYTSTGSRQWGLYHRILLNDFSNVTSVLSNALQAWGSDCRNNGWSCGMLFYITVAGTGSMMIAHQVWGPFI